MCYVQIFFHTVSLMDENEAVRHTYSLYNGVHCMITSFSKLKTFKAFFYVFVSTYV